MFFVVLAKHGNRDCWNGWSGSGVRIRSVIFPRTRKAEAQRGSYRRHSLDILRCFIAERMIFRWSQTYLMHTGYWDRQGGKHCRHSMRVNRNYSWRKEVSSSRAVALSITLRISAVILRAAVKTLHLSKQMWFVTTPPPSFYVSGPRKVSERDVFCCSR